MILKPKCLRNVKILVVEYFLCTFIKIDVYENKY